MTTTPSTTLADLKQEAWDLSELLPEPSDKEISARLEELEEAVSDFERGRQDLSATMGSAELLDKVRAYDALLSRLYVLGYYGSLWFSADTQSAEALALSLIHI